MSKKNKLQRFAELGSLPNVYQNPSLSTPHLVNSEGEQAELRGLWSKGHFKNEHPLVLELACGKGDYAVALAKDFPEKNFVGVDLKGNRIWKGATTALNQGVPNVAFLRTQIEFLPLFFGTAEVNEIWITFPDPYPRLSKFKKRLTSSRFLATYRKVLAPGGIVHLKTDDPGLYEFTLETLAEEGIVPIYHHDDIYSAPLAYPELAYKTYYEGMHLQAGKTIKYVRFSF